jgi:hypothetical protein
MPPTTTKTTFAVDDVPAGTGRLPTERLKLSVERLLGTPVEACDSYAEEVVRQLAGACRMKEAVSAALGRLTGLPLWGVGRAGVAWFQFGSRRAVQTARGGTKEVGDLALHLACPWRLVGPAGEVLACDESGPEVFTVLGSPPLLCSGVRAWEGGAFELEFAGGERLQVGPGDPHCEEYWRLFQPGSGERHFVVGPAGIDPTA